MSLFVKHLSYLLAQSFAACRRCAPLVGVFCVSVLVAAQEPQRVLRVGASSDYYPYSYVDSSGRLSGYAADLLAEVAQTINVRLDYTVRPTSELSKGLRENEIDLILVHTRPDGGDEWPISSSSYLTLQGVLFTREGDGRFHSLSDVRDKQGVLAASRVGLRHALAHGVPAANIRQLPAEGVLRELSLGRVDAALLTRLTGMAQARRLGLGNVAPVGLPVKGYTVRFCFAARPQDSALIAEINDGLEILRQNGRQEELYSKWFSEYEPRRFSAAQVTVYVASALGFSLLIALWAIVRSRQLNARIARQATELAESHSILAEAQHFAHIGHWRIEAGSPTRCLWSDETFLILERDRALGPLPCQDLIECVVESDRPRFAEAYAQLAKNHRAFSLDVVMVVGLGSRKTLHWRGRPIYDQKGAPVGSFGTVQDLTERRGAEQALQASERLLRALYETLPLGLGVVDLLEDGWRVKALNPEALRQLGLPGQDLLGRRLTQLGLTADELEFYTDLLGRAILAGGAVRVERSHDLGRRLQAVTAVPVQGPGKRLCLLLEDVTERRNRDAELETGRRLRAIGELVGGIAHEFNNLLTPIMLTVESIEGDQARADGLHEDLAIMRDATQRASDLTKRLLTFGRRNVRDLAPLDVYTVVSGSIEVLRPACDRRILFECSSLRGLPQVNASLGDLNQVFMNLLLNARDALSAKLATDKGGAWAPRISITASLHPADAFMPVHSGMALDRTGWLRVSVRDNGCGMSPELAERIFEPFFTTKPVGKGSGLGLATVWHLVAELGGRIDLESKPGEGSVFHLCFPLGGAAEAAAVASTAIVVPHPVGPLRLLVVEDESRIAELVVLLLEDQGHKAAHAGNGRVAWELISAQPDAFDGVIMDLSMPEMDGLELARRLRAQGFTKPIMVMSGRVSEEDYQQLASLGVSEVINKPFDSKTLRAAVARAFGAVS